jgi:tetratricopeptide (TPR) repeat protein
MTDETRPLVETVLAAVHDNDAEGIATAFNRLDELGGAAAPAIVTALDANGLTDAMLAALQRRAQELDTALAWSQLANAATVVGRDDLAIQTAGTALQRDPATPNAAFILSVVANRRGDHDAALRAIADLIGRVPAAKDDPYLMIQNALAELGRNQPQAALAIVDASLPRLTAAGLGFDAHWLHARALGMLPERSAEAVGDWERTLTAALHPVQTDLARDGLIAALWRAKRYDDSLRQMDEGIAATTNAQTRSAWLEARPNLLMSKGDIDGAIAALDDLLTSTTDPERRLQLRLNQARVVASVSRWKEAATRFDVALAEIPPAADASSRRHEIRLEKAQTLASHDIDSVLADLDELDARWTASGWPLPTDVRMTGLLAAGRAAGALVWLEQQVSRTPALAEHPAAHQLRGDAELKLGHTDEAMRWYARAVEITPAAADQRGWGALLMSAFATQKWKAAVAAYDQLVKLNPASPLDATLRVIAAAAHLRLGEFEIAMKLTEEPLPSQPRFRELRDHTRAEAQLQLRQFDDALATTGEALKRCQGEPSGEVPANVLVVLHVLRAQAFNALEQFQAARDAASAAIAVPNERNVEVEGLTAFLRVGAYMQRSLALYKLGEKSAAHQDIDAAIAGFERLRNSAILRLMKTPDLESVETSLWYAKGAVLDAESRIEEALAAYSRAQRLETHGNAAALRKGYALTLTGAFEKALAAFEDALTRASSSQERSDALAGKGRALVRLERFEEAILALQTALDERLTDPDNDPDVFELLGIAYDALKRNGAALRAFRRVWTLTPEDKRSANLARGVTAAELWVSNPTAALEFLDALPRRLKDDRTLLLNRALALDALGQRPAAIDCLVRARDAGLYSAQRELHRLDAPAGLGRWTHHWFGAQARRGRRAGGTVLLLIAATGFAAPLFQWSLEGKLHWYLLLLPSAVALALLALPNMKSITAEAGPFKLEAEPQPATGREATAPGAPESFTVPTLGAVAVTATESKPAGV